ncbi:MAG: phosphotransferase [Ilumatobacter sp.]
MTWQRVPLVTRVVLAAHSGRKGADVLALAGSSDWRRSALDKTGACIVRVLGSGIGASAVDPVWPTQTWEELDDELSSALPGLGLVGAVLPRQPGRRRLSLLGQLTGTEVVVKLGAVDAEIRNEAEALALLERNPLPGIATPRPLGAGTIRGANGDADYLVTTSIAIRRQSAAIDEPLRTFEKDLSVRLAELAPDSAASGSVPIHGDLTPWNLRRTPRGLALFDWEAAGWGAPGSDIANYRRACDDVRRPWSRRRPTPRAT